MIEKIIYDYLIREGIQAYLEMPKNTPEYPFVIIEKTGSSERNLIKYATIAIQSYGESMYDVIVLNELVKLEMKNAIVLPEITSVILNSDYNFTDTTTKRYRYQAVFNVTHY